MRILLLVLSLVSLLGCSQEYWLQKFSSPADQATAKSYIDRLRAGKFDEIERALDPSIRTPDSPDMLAKMAALIPNGKPTSVKLVGAQTFESSGAKTVNTTFEYNFGGQWLLANVAVRDRQATETVVGFHVKPIAQSLESQNRFTFAGKSILQYAVLVSAIAAVLLTLYAVIVCAKTKLPRRKWLWVLFILVGFGKVAVNWTTGGWGIVPLSVQLFSASATAPLYGPWTVTVSLPLGALIFLLYRRPRLVQKGEM